MAALLHQCWRTGGTVLALGNGGSAATASHFACDLAKGTRIEGLPAFRVLSLADCMPLLTAWANDDGYENVFAAQIEALIRPGDVLLLISVSGNSPNVLAAAETARVAGATLVALTGRSGGALRTLADLSVGVPSDSVEQVEDVHLIIVHSICVALRKQLCAEAALLREPARPLAVELGS